MKFFALKRKKLWKIIALLFLIPILVLGVILIYVYAKQEAILQDQIAELNTKYTGKIVVGKSHVSLFKNFPDISFKIDDLECRKRLLLFKNKNQLI